MELLLQVSPSESECWQPTKSQGPIRQERRDCSSRPSSQVGNRELRAYWTASHLTTTRAHDADHADHSLKHFFGGVLQNKYSRKLLMSRCDRSGIRACNPIKRPNYSLDPMLLSNLDYSFVFPDRDSSCWDQPVRHFIHVSHWWIESQPSVFLSVRTYDSVSDRLDNSDRLRPWR